MSEFYLPVEGKTKLTKILPLIERVKLIFVTGLRTAFSSSLTHPDIKYDEDESKTKIKIYTAYPLKVEFLPVIVVSVSSGNLGFNFLQDDFISEAEENDEKILIYGGKVPITITLSILSNGTLEREKIIDHLIFFLRHLFVNLFRRYGIFYIKDMNLGNEGIIEVAGRLVYEQAITIPCYLEYQAKVSLAEIETLERITVEIINSQLTGGS